MVDQERCDRAASCFNESMVLHQCGCCGGNANGKLSAYSCSSCYICGLKGLLHASKSLTTLTQKSSTNALLSSMFPYGQYDLILDRPSLQKWWNEHHQADLNRRGNSWDNVIVMELIRALHILHHKDIDTTTVDGAEEIGMKKPVVIRIISVFISMDIFQTNRVPREKLQLYQDQQQSDMIHKLLYTMRESLPHIQSVHLYNGPISCNVFAHSLTMNAVLNDPNDVEDDGIASMASDDNSVPSTQREHRLYHRWNRFNMDDDDDYDDDRDDHEHDIDMNNHMMVQEQNDDDSDNDDDDTEFPVMLSGSMLASIIESSTLQSIIVTRCLCFYDSSDISALAKSLQNHSHLCSVHLASMYLHPNCFMKANTTSVIVSSCMDPLMIALSTITQLESLNITLAKESRLSISHPTLRQTTKSTPNTIISPQSLRQLIAGTTMRDLTLWECLLNGSHLSAISDALLHGSSSSSGGRNEVTATTNTDPKETFLQFLSLRCNPHISCDDWCNFYTRTLPNCYSIQSIYNDHVCGLADCDPSLPNHGKTTCMSPTREGLRFWDFDATTTTSDETSSTELSTAEAAANAELFLGLNSLGRGSIIHGSYSNSTAHESSNTDLKFTRVSENDENFLDILSDVTDTPSALYALIRGHPMMILSFIRH